MSEPVQFVVVAHPFAWPGVPVRTLGAYSLHAVAFPWGTHRARLPASPVNDLNSRTSLSETVATVLERTVYESGERVLCHERRRRARHGSRGRRSAASIPFETQRRAHVYAVEGTPEHIVLALLRGLVPVTSKVYKRQPVKDVVRGKAKR